MKSIKCEMCDSADVIKQGEYYVCQSCGTKYEPEAARKLMVEIDNSGKSENLYKLARRAKDEDNTEMALKYYSQLLELHPDDWEAYYYTAYFNTQNTTIANITVAASNFSRVFTTVFTLLKQSNLKPAEIVTEATLVAGTGSLLASQMMNVAAQSHNEFLQISYEVGKEHEPEYIANTIACLDVQLAIGDAIESVFLQDGSDQFSDLESVAVEVWKHGAEMSKYDSSFAVVKRKSSFSERIQRYDSTYVEPASQASGGCYVATAVYGSYDCPEVWTLRRFRDYRLKSTFIGRIFIRVYYFVSPTLVRAFGRAKWFNALFRHPLDALVARCKSDGYADTPYYD